MNILLINHYAGSDYHGMEFRPFYLARLWNQMGHDTTILAADFSHLRKKNPAPQKDFDEEIVDGVRFVWVKTLPYQGNGAKRALNMMTFVNKVKAKAGYLAERYQPDAVIASSTYPFDIYPAEKIAKKAKAKLIFEIHDLWPLSPIVLYGLKESNPLIRYLQQAEDAAFTRSDTIVSILPNAAKHVAERKADPEKCFWIPNGIFTDEQEAPVPAQTTEYLESLKKQGKFIVMYLGGFATANALEELIECSPKLNPDVAVVLIGDGMKKQEYMAYSKEKGYSNLHFLDSVSKKAVQPVLRMADCLYVGAKKCRLYEYGVGMNKFNDYMLSSRPIISGVEAYQDPVSESGCGVLVEPENSAELAKAINAMSLAEKADLDSMGQKGYEYVIQHHNYPDLARRFIEVIS